MTVKINISRGEKIRVSNFIAPDFQNVGFLTKEMPQEKYGGMVSIAEACCISDVYFDVLLPWY